MNVYLVTVKKTGWCQDYAMVVVAEDEKHAERKARWSSDDLKKSCRNCSRENKFEPRTNDTDSKYRSIKYMTKQEILDYLKSTGLYDDSKTALLYVKDMLNDNKTIPVAELVERIVKIDKEFNGRPWNILQILTNIDMLVPLEDRK